MNPFFNTIFTLGLMASAMALIALGIRTCFRRMPRIYTYVLWIFVFIRAILPISYSSSFSLWTLFQKAPSQTLTAEQTMCTVEPSSMLFFRSGHCAKPAAAYYIAFIPKNSAGPPGHYSSSLGYRNFSPAALQHNSRYKASPDRPLFRTKPKIQSKMRLFGLRIRSDPNGLCPWIFPSLHLSAGQSVRRAEISDFRA